MDLGDIVSPCLDKGCQPFDTRICRTTGQQAGIDISGLPLLSMKPRQIMGILTGTFGYLRDNGAFYQFTYGPRCPVPSAILGRLGLRATRIGTTVRNMPPSSVYKIERLHRIGDALNRQSA